MRRTDDHAYALLPGAFVKRGTDKALCVSVPMSDGTNREAWIPRSIIHDDSEVWGTRYEDGFETCGPGNLIAPMWWVRERGFEDAAEEYP